MPNFTGFIDLVAESHDQIDLLYEEKQIDLPKPELTKTQNLYIELCSPTVRKSKALCRVKEDKLILVESKPTISGLKPKNREQVFAFDALMDPEIELVVLTGRAGTGKSLMAIAGGLNFTEGKKNRRMILSKPMTQIGKHKLGTLPGEVNEKFNPYLKNYESNFDQVMGKHVDLEDIVAMYHIEFCPIQLFLGASFTNTYFCIDEVQNCEDLELGALLTRCGQKCKVVIMGDYKQVHDEVTNQGLSKLVNSDIVKASPLVAVIELQKCERGNLAELMSRVFEE